MKNEVESVEQRGLGRVPAVVETPDVGKVSNYFLRTHRHIQRVQTNMLCLVTVYAEHLNLSLDQRREAMYNVLNHDRSKFSPEQFEPYIELTEYYRQRRVLGNKDFDYTPEMREMVDRAVENHYQVENHHPEKFKGTIGKWDQLEALEAACDLQAMAQEFNEGSCRKYFEKQWKPRQRENFYDDYNWWNVIAWMEEAIACFEEKAVAQTHDGRDDDRSNLGNPLSGIKEQLESLLEVLDSLETARVGSRERLKWQRRRKGVKQDG